jgi:small-conductance mechanosensitive channel
MKIVVPFGADPVLVRRILFEEANAAVATAPGLVGAPAPAVWLMPGFGEYGMEFTVIVWMATFVDQYEGQTQIRTRILKRLRAEGIEIPVPIRTVRLEHLDGRPDGRFSPEGRDVASS